jgi:hypothetical protein
MARKLPELLRRWNTAEPLLREALVAYDKGKMSAEDTLTTIDTLIAAATGRGNSLGELFKEPSELELKVWDYFEANWIANDQLPTKRTD